MIKRVFFVKRCKAPSPVSIYGGECQIRKLQGKIKKKI